jgi:hypothetical protein
MAAPYSRTLALVVALSQLLAASSTAAPSSRSTTTTTTTTTILPEGPGRLEGQVGTKPPAAEPLLAASSTAASSSRSTTTTTTTTTTLPEGPGRLEGQVGTKPPAAEPLPTAGTGTTLTEEQTEEQIMEIRDSFIADRTEVLRKYEDPVRDSPRVLLQARGPHCDLAQGPTLAAEEKFDLPEWIVAPPAEPRA